MENQKNLIYNEENENNYNFSKTEEKEKNLENISENALSEEEKSKIREIKKTSKKENNYADYKVEISFETEAKLLFLAVINKKGKTKKELQNYLNELLDEIIENKFKEHSNEQ